MGSRASSLSDLVVLTAYGWRRRRFSVVSLDVSLGGIGQVQLRPREEDIQVAHKIWTQLVTRKAAVRIDPAHDVITEVYDSWYSLFGRVRELISELPARLVREDPATQELVLDRDGIAEQRIAAAPHSVASEVPELVRQSKRTA